MPPKRQQRRDQSGNRFLFKGLISLDNKHASVRSTPSLARVMQDEEMSENKTQHVRAIENERKEKSSTAELRAFVHVHCFDEIVEVADISFLPSKEGRRENVDDVSSSP